MSASMSAALVYEPYHGQTGRIAGIDLDASTARASRIDISRYIPARITNCEPYMTRMRPNAIGFATRPLEATATTSPRMTDQRQTCTHRVCDSCVHAVRGRNDAQCQFIGPVPRDRAGHVILALRSQWSMRGDHPILQPTFARRDLHMLNRACAGQVRCHTAEGVNTLGGDTSTAARSLCPSGLESCFNNSVVPPPQRGSCKD
ncbi:hypothetical protein PENSPDRAFT_359962 [Peniophora sp. CONT]|nr:hypothetical protein PENSPDRAFT_359962 [Peniophora sp. CONT]